MLWLFFVVLKTAGEGLGTYLSERIRKYKRVLHAFKLLTYHATSTSRADKNLMRACRIYMHELGDR